MVELVRVDPRDRVVAAQEPFLDHRDRSLHCGGGGSLGGSGLQEVQPALLHRELDVLDVAVVTLEPLDGLLELVERVREQPAHLIERKGQPDSCHHILALRIHEELAAETALARRGVAAEAHAGPAVVALVPEHHLHHVDGGAEIVGNLVLLPVDPRTRRVPRVEDGAHGAQQLLVRIRERSACLLVVDLLVALDQDHQVRGAEIDVVLDAAFGLELVEGGLELMGSTPSTTSPYIWIRRRYESCANRALPVAPANPRTALSFRPRSRIESIIPGIEIAAPERTETSRGFDGSPNIAPVMRSSRLDVLGDLVLEAFRQLSAARQVRTAGVGRDREARRNRDAEVRHLRQPEALAAEQLPPTMGGLVEGVHHSRSCLRVQGQGLHCARSSRGDEQNFSWSPTPLSRKRPRLRLSRAIWAEGRFLTRPTPRLLALRRPDSSRSTPPGRLSGCCRGATPTRRAPTVRWPR